MSDNLSTYSVDYGTLDEFKKKALEAARLTGYELPHGYRPVPDSFGGSVSLIENDSHYLALVVEGLGTFDESERLFFEQSGGSSRNSFRHSIARHTAATMLNDLAVCGAEPLITNPFIAVGSSSWFAGENRSSHFVAGWKDSCLINNSMWGGGETQELQDVVSPGSAVLAGATMGIISPKNNRIVGDVQPGDIMVGVKSSGVEQNGHTMVRNVVQTLPDKFLSIMKDGQSLAHALFTSPVFYGPLIRRLQDAGRHIVYVSTITGHGWRKIMRRPQELRYVVTHVPELDSIFPFIQKHSGATTRTMYKTFNMSLGAVFFFRTMEAADDLIAMALVQGQNAFKLGYVEEGPRSVFIEPLGITFDSDEYKVD